MKQTIKKKEKDFDCVKMMRDIRDKISRDIMHMTHDEQRAYFERLRAKAWAKKPAKKAA